MYAAVVAGVVVVVVAVAVAVVVELENVVLVPMWVVDLEATGRGRWPETGSQPF